MIQIYNKNTLSDIYKRIPEDRFSGNGSLKDFALYNLTPELLARVFVAETLKGTNTDFYTFAMAGTNFISFLSTPPAGTNNIICQSDECLFFPGGTTQTGYMNGYAGDSVDIEFYLLNDDSSAQYFNIILTPDDEIGKSISDETTFFKIASTQAGLDTATAGQPLNFGSILDSNVFHSFWVRLTIPEHFLAADVPALNKNDLSLKISALEY